MATPNDGLNQKADKKTRPVHVFAIPESLANGTTSVGMVTLTAEEELLAWKRSRGENARLATELVKASLAEVNGEPVTLHDGSVDAFWKDLHPKIRQLVLTAYADLHAAEEDDQKAFLASRRVKVG